MICAGCAMPNYPASVLSGIGNMARGHSRSGMAGQRRTVNLGNALVGGAVHRALPLMAQHQFREAQPVARDDRLMGFNGKRR
jgi:hypothetical protein